MRLRTGGSDSERYFFRSVEPFFFDLAPYFVEDFFPLDFFLVATAPSLVTVMVSMFLAGIWECGDRRLSGPACQVLRARYRAGMQ